MSITSISLRESTAVGKSDALELDRDTLWQLLDGHAGAGRLVLAKVLLVHTIPTPGKVKH